MSIAPEEHIYAVLSYYVPWDDMKNACQPPNPQAIADIVADEMDGIGTPPSIAISKRLRAGDGNQYIAGRLGLT